MSRSDEFVLERTNRRDDGRYVLYYSWPDEDDGGAVHAPEPREAAPTGPKPPTEPWSPESGPAPDVEPARGDDV